jgi:hypothetical protein
VLKCRIAERYPIRIAFQFSSFDRNSPPRFDGYFASEEGYQLLEPPDFKRRPQGTWLLGVLMGCDRYIKMNTVSDHSLAKLPTLVADVQDPASLYVTTGAISGDSSFMVATENGLLDLTMSLESRVIPATETRSQVSCMQLVDPQYMAIGTVEGSCLILRRGEGACWHVYRRFHHNDKAITDFLMIETSIVVASEDRRLSLVNLTTGLVESQVAHAHR